jgi:hypothetical protein
MFEGIIDGNEGILALVKHGVSVPSDSSIRQISGHFGMGDVMMELMYHSGKMLPCNEMD